MRHKIFIFFLLMLNHVSDSLGDVYGDSNYGEVYDYYDQDPEEDYNVGRSSSNRRKSGSTQTDPTTPSPQLEVHYDISLETNGNGVNRAEYDSDNDQHPALRKYGTFKNGNGNNYNDYTYVGGRTQPTARTTPTTTTTRRTTTRRTTRSTTTTTTTTTPRRGRYDLNRSRSNTRPIPTPVPAMTTEPTEPGLILRKDDVDEQERQGNLLVYLDYRKEDSSCPEGYVLDIYGYCREIFHEERRDWDWWTNIRRFIFEHYGSDYLPNY